MLNVRVDFTVNRTIGPHGDEVPCAAEVYIPPTYPDPATGEDVDLTIGGQDRIIFLGRTYAVAQVNWERGWLGDQGDHWRVAIR